MKDVEEVREDTVVFHYNREKRLEHAPEAVRRAYEEGFTAKGGFFRGLTANAGLRSIFVIIIILFAVIFFLTFQGDNGGTETLKGVQFKLKAFLYEETVYVTLNCTEIKPGSASGDIIVKINGIDQNGDAVFIKDLSGVAGSAPLILRTTMPDFELRNVSASVNFNKTDAILTVSVDRK